MSPTEEYVRGLRDLKAGDLGVLRSHLGQGLDESVDGFDLFAGIWWPLRARNQRAPRREVAWLIAKLYALRPIKHSPGDTVARQLARCRPDEETRRKRFEQKVDTVLSLPLEGIEPALHWALDVLASKDLGVDWVRLTDDLSFWERPTARLRWAQEFLESSKEVAYAD